MSLKVASFNCLSKFRKDSVMEVGMEVAEAAVVVIVLLISYIKHRI